MKVKPLYYTSSVDVVLSVSVYHGDADTRPVPHHRSVLQVSSISIRQILRRRSKGASAVLPSLKTVSFLRRIL